MTPNLAPPSQAASHSGPRWQLGLMAFFVWIAVEDQLRKSLENPLVVYLIKDVVLAFVLVRCLQTARVRPRKPAIPRAFGMILFWGLILHVLGSLSPLLTNRLAALVGIKLAFSYMPLIYLGYRFAEEGGRIDRFCRSVMLTGVAVSMIGVYQATVDPTFLTPEALGGLEGAQLRWSRGSVPYVTSTFLSPGRYVLYLLNVFAAGLYVILVEPRRRLRLVWLALLGVIVLGLITTGTRLGLAAVPLLLATLVAVAWIRVAHRSSQTRLLARSGTTAAVVLLFSIALLALAANFSPPVADALSFYWDSMFSKGGAGFLDRQLYHVEEITKADPLTLVFGRGTGSASFGVGYLQDAPEVMTEGGFASIVWELGILGLVFYCALAGYVSSAFLDLRRAAAAPGTPLIAFMASFTPLVLFELWYVNVLYPVLQQYVVAVFLWFLTGVCLALRDAHSRPAGAMPPARAWARVSA
jgi:hypothetical protein